MAKSLAPEEAAPHELEFVAAAASWMNLIIEKGPSLPFSEARIEGRSKSSQKRRDLSLIGKDRKILVTGEVKLPYQKDGATPYNATVVSDARRKAIRANARYFFTWNVNECMLWETETSSDNPREAQHYRSWKVTSVVKESHLTLPSTEAAIKRWLGQFLNDLGKIIPTATLICTCSLTQRFTNA